MQIDTPQDGLTGGTDFSDDKQVLELWEHWRGLRAAGLRLIFHFAPQYFLSGERQELEDEVEVILLARWLGSTGTKDERGQRHRQKHGALGHFPRQSVGGDRHS